MYTADPYVDPSFGAPVPTYVPSYDVGRSSKFKQLNCCAYLCALIIFGVLIAAATVCWYSYSTTYYGATPTSSVGTSTNYNLNYTSSCFTLQGVTVQTKSSSGSVTSTYTLYNPSSSLWSTFKLVQAFVLIGLLLSGLLAIFLLLVFADSLRNQLLFVLGMNVLRIVLLAIAALILISLTIAFLGFLGITNAFSNDNPGCTLGYCSRFADSVVTQYGSNTVTVSGVSQTLNVSTTTTWGANAGWYLVLGCIPVAILLAILVVINKFPIPVDSVGSGEAL